MSELSVDVKVALRASTWRALDKFAKENHYESVGSLLAVMGERVFLQAQHRERQKSQMAVLREEDHKRIAKVRGRRRTDALAEQKATNMRLTRELHAKGLNDRQIGEELGLTSSRINQYRHEMNLESNNKKKAAA